MRKASGNRRSLDDLAKEMRTLQDRGQAPTPTSWAALVRRELGDEGVSTLDRMLAGGAPLPSSDAFGPCFRRISRELQRYELGFDPAVLVETERIVRGLVPGSAADLAGLRNGDRILKPVPQDAIQGNQEARLTLQVRRDGQDSTIIYRPRGETVSAWQWERIPTAPEETCRASRVASVHLPHVIAPEESTE
jgi:predicted metalloprotease with PDZ domain